MNYPANTAAALLIFLSGCGEAPSSNKVPEAAALSSGPADNGSHQTSITPSKAAASASPSIAPDHAPPRLSIDPDGLRWFLQPSGASRALPFGMPQTDVLASVEGVRGEATKGTNTDCGAGPVAFAGWPDGLSLLFQSGRFVGWGLDGRAKGGMATADGVGIGSTRAALDAAIGPHLQVRKTTLGTEFTAGQYHGLFSGGAPEAIVTDMWAGVSCVAR
jgi:hypothetical protein